MPHHRAARFCAYVCYHNCIIGVYRFCLTLEIFKSGCHPKIWQNIQTKKIAQLRVLTAHQHLA